MNTEPISIIKNWEQKYKDNLFGIFLFELKSLIGRLIKSNRPNTECAHNLNLGCGQTKYEGFVNADFFCNFRFWRNKKTVKPDWELDFRYPLKCENNIWEGVYTEHVIEHLYRDDVIKLLLELHRTMQVGATIRIIVPDTKAACQDYVAGKFLSEDEYGAKLIWQLTQNWGHKSVWDFDLLSKALSDCGFKEIQEVSFMEGRQSALLKDSPHRRHRSLYVEAVR